MFASGNPGCSPLTVWLGGVNENTVQILLSSMLGEKLLFWNLGDIFRMLVLDIFLFNLTVKGVKINIGRGKVL